MEKKNIIENFIEFIINKLDKKKPVSLRKISRFANEHNLNLIRLANEIIRRAKIEGIKSEQFSSLQEAMNQRIKPKRQKIVEHKIKPKTGKTPKSKAEHDESAARQRIYGFMKENLGYRPYSIQQRAKEPGSWWPEATKGDAIKKRKRRRR